MPNGNNIESTLRTARNVLSSANSAFPSSMAPKAPAPKTAAAPKPPTSNEEFGTPERSVKEGLAANRANVAAYEKAYPKMHNGGPVPHDGLYQMKRGEHVLTEAEAKKARKFALMGAGMASLAKAAPKVVKAAKENKKSGGLTTTVAPSKMV